MESSTKKTVILYKTKYGSTKKYAEWIAESIDADIFDVSQFDASQIDKYSTVVFGSFVHGGKINNISFIRSNWSSLSEKKVVVFASTNAPSDDPGQNRVFEASLPMEIRNKTKYFPLRGAFDFKNLDFIDKLTMQFPRLILQIGWYIGRNTKAKEYLNNFKVTHDYTNKKAIEPIVSFLKQ